MFIAMIGAVEHVSDVGARTEHAARRLRVCEIDADVKKRASRRFLTELRSPPRHAVYFPFRRSQQLLGKRCAGNSADAYYDGDFACVDVITSKDVWYILGAGHIITMTLASLPDVCPVTGSRSSSYKT